MRIEIYVIPWLLFVFCIVCSLSAHPCADRQTLQNSFQFVSLGVTRSKRDCQHRCCEENGRCEVSIHTATQCYGLKCNHPSFCKFISQQLRDFRGHRVDKRDVDGDVVNKQLDLINGNLHHSLEDDSYDNDSSDNDIDDNSQQQELKINHEITKEKDSLKDDSHRTCIHTNKRRTTIPRRTRGFRFHKFHGGGFTLDRCSQKCCRKNDCMFSFKVENHCYGVLCDDEKNCHVRRDKLSQLNIFFSNTLQGKNKYQEKANRHQHHNQDHHHAYSPEDEGESERDQKPVIDDEEQNEVTEEKHGSERPHLKSKDKHKHQNPAVDSDEGNDSNYIEAHAEAFEKDTKTNRIPFVENTNYRKHHFLPNVDEDKEVAERHHHHHHHGYKNQELIDEHTIEKLMKDEENNRKLPHHHHHHRDDNEGESIGATLPTYHGIGDNVAVDEKIDAGASGSGVAEESGDGQTQQISNHHPEFYQNHRHLKHPHHHHHHHHSHRNESSTASVNGTADQNKNNISMNNQNLNNSREGKLYKSPVKVNVAIPTINVVHYTKISFNNNNDNKSMESSKLRHNNMHGLANEDNLSTRNKIEKPIDEGPRYEHKEDIFKQFSHKLQHHQQDESSGEESSGDGVVENIPHGKEASKQKIKMLTKTTTTISTILTTPTITPSPTTPTTTPVPTTTPTTTTTTTITTTTTTPTTTTPNPKKIVAILKYQKHHARPTRPLLLNTTITTPTTPSPITIITSLTKRKKNSNKKKLTTTVTPSTTTTTKLIPTVAVDGISVETTATPIKLKHIANTSNGSHVLHLPMEEDTLKDLTKTKLKSSKPLLQQKLVKKPVPSLNIAVGDDDDDNGNSDDAFPNESMTIKPSNTKSTSITNSTKDHTTTTKNTKQKLIPSFPKTSSTVSKHQSQNYEKNGQKHFPIKKTEGKPPLPGEKSNSSLNSISRKKNTKTTQKYTQSKNNKKQNNTVLTGAKKAEQNHLKQINTPLGNVRPNTLKSNNAVTTKMKPKNQSVSSFMKKTSTTPQPITTTHAPNRVLKPTTPVHYKQRYSTSFPLFHYEQVNPMPYPYGGNQQQHMLPTPPVYSHYNGQPLDEYPNGIYPENFERQNENQNSQNEDRYQSFQGTGRMFPEQSAHAENYQNRGEYRQHEQRHNLGSLPSDLDSNFNPYNLGYDNSRLRPTRKPSTTPTKKWTHTPGKERTPSKSRPQTITPGLQSKPLSIAPGLKSKPPTISPGLQSKPPTISPGLQSKPPTISPGLQQKVTQKPKTNLPTLSPLKPNINQQVNSEAKAHEILNSSNFKNAPTLMPLHTITSSMFKGTHTQSLIIFPTKGGNNVKLLYHDGNKDSTHTQKFTTSRNSSRNLRKPSNGRKSGKNKESPLDTINRILNSSIDHLKDINSVEQPIDTIHRILGKDNQLDDFFKEDSVHHNVEESRHHQDLLQSDDNLKPEKSNLENFFKKTEVETVRKNTSDVTATKKTSLNRINSFKNDTHANKTSSVLSEEKLPQIKGCSIDKHFSKQMFTNVHDVGYMYKVPQQLSFTECVQSCCSHDTCHVAFFDQKQTCHLVQCKNLSACNDISPTNQNIRLVFIKKSNTGRVASSKYCEAHDSVGVPWQRTKAGDVSIRDCPRDAVGEAKRDCNIHTQWQPPDFSDCVSSSYAAISDKTKNLGFTTSVQSLIKELNDASTETIDNSLMFGGDLRKATATIHGIATFLANNNKEDFNHDEYKGIIRIVSNLLDMANTNEWANIKDMHGLSILMKSMEMIGTFAADRLTTPSKRSVATSSIIASVDKVILNPKLRLTQRFSYPDYGEQQNNEWLRTQDKIILPRNLFKKDRSTAVSSVVYKTLASFLPHRWNAKKYVTFTDGYSVNSNILSCVLHPNPPKVISPPVLVTLHHIKQQHVTQSKCAWWDFNSSNGSWSTNGCSVVSSNRTTTTCKCSHLTHFAILSNSNDQKISAKEQVKEHAMAMVWLGIPMIVVVMIGALYTCFAWSKVPRRRHVVIMDKKPSLPKEDTVVTQTISEQYPGSPNKNLYCANNCTSSPSDLEWEHAWDILSNSEIDSSTTKDLHQHFKEKLLKNKLLRPKRRNTPSESSTSSSSCNSNNLNDSSNRASYFQWKAGNDVKEWRKQRLTALSGGVLDVSEKAAQPVLSSRDDNQSNHNGNHESTAHTISTIESFSPVAMSSPHSLSFEELLQAHAAAIGKGQNYLQISFSAAGADLGIEIPHSSSMSFDSLNQLLSDMETTDEELLNEARIDRDFCSSVESLVQSTNTLSDQVSSSDDTGYQSPQSRRIRLNDESGDTMKNHRNKTNSLTIIAKSYREHIFCRWSFDTFECNEFCCQTHIDRLFGGQVCFLNEVGSSASKENNFGTSKQLSDSMLDLHLLKVKKSNTATIPVLARKKLHKYFMENTRVSASGCRMKKLSRTPDNKQSPSHSFGNTRLQTRHLKNYIELRQQCRKNDVQNDDDNFQSASKQKQSKCSFTGESVDDTKLSHHGRPSLQRKFAFKASHCDSDTIGKARQRMLQKNSLRDSLKSKDLLSSGRRRCRRNRLSNSSTSNSSIESICQSTSHSSDSNESSSS